MTKEYTIKLSVPDDEPLSIAAPSAIGWAGVYAKGYLEGCYNQMLVGDEQVIFTDINGVGATLTRVS